MKASPLDYKPYGTKKGDRTHFWIEAGPNHEYLNCLYSMCGLNSLPDNLVECSTKPLCLKCTETYLWEAKFANR